MKRALIGGYIGICLWAFNLQSCQKDHFTPGVKSDADSTYVGSTCGTDSTSNGTDPSDSTDWNGGNGNGSDSTDWNGGNPGDSLPG